jgi:hypothetical protein
LRKNSGSTKLSLLLAFVALSLLVSTLYAAKQHDLVRVELEIEKAQNATGPCGQEFVRILSNGRVAVAGQIVMPERVADFYMKETDGLLTIYERNETGKDKEIFVRYGN